MSKRSGIPPELASYVDELTSRVEHVAGSDLLGVWLIGSGAQGVYEHALSDVDLMAVSATRWPVDVRAALGGQIVHPVLPCPTVGVEFVWYAEPDLRDLADPVVFQLNVNGGTERASAISLEPDREVTWWPVLDLAAARAVGVPIVGPPAADVIPEVPGERLHQAIRESLRWHDAADAGSPNRVLNLARLIVLLEQGTWVSKPQGAALLRQSRPEWSAALDEALRARAEKRWLDGGLAQPLSDRLAELVG